MLSQVLFISVASFIMLLKQLPPEQLGFGIYLYRHLIIPSKYS